MLKIWLGVVFLFFVGCADDIDMWGHGPRVPTKLSVRLEYIGDKNIDVGYPLQFSACAHSSVNGALSYSVIGLPDGATFSTDDRQFIWTPKSSDIGIHLLTFTATDQSGTISESISLEVLDPTSTTPRLPRIFLDTCINP